MESFEGLDTEHQKGGCFESFSSIGDSRGITSRLEYLLVTAVVTAFPNFC